MAKETPTTAADREVALRDEAGNEIGTTMRLDPEPGEPEPDDETGVKTLASRITGWTKLVIDGETYTFSKGRALALLNRFPHFAAQVRAALDEGA